MFLILPRGTFAKGKHWCTPWQNIKRLRLSPIYKIRIYFLTKSLLESTFIDLFIQYSTYPFFPLLMLQTITISSLWSPAKERDGLLTSDRIRVTDPKNPGNMPTAIKATIDVQVWKKITQPLLPTHATSLTSYFSDPSCRAGQIPAWTGKYWIRTWAPSDFLRNGGAVLQQWRYFGMERNCQVGQVWRRCRGWRWQVVETSRCNIVTAFFVRVAKLLGQGCHSAGHGSINVSTVFDPIIWTGSPTIFYSGWKTSLTCCWTTLSMLTFYHMTRGILSRTPSWKSTPISLRNPRRPRAQRTFSRNPSLKLAALPAREAVRYSQSDDCAFWCGIASLIL